MAMADTKERGEDLRNETEVWEKCSYTWIIRNMDSFFKGGVGNKVASSSFYSKPGNDYGWQINLYPSGFDFASQDFLGVYLYSLSKEEIRTRFTLSIRDSGDCIIGAKSQEFCFTNQHKVSGFPETVMRSHLLPAIRDNIMKIHAEIYIKVLNLRIEDYIVSPGPNFPTTRLQSSMAGLFDSCKFSDVVFNVGEKNFNVHKSILVARSPVFEAMFTHDSIEKQSGLVVISDFDSEIFKRFLGFVYSSKIDIPAVNIATELFRAAEKYDFPDLKLQCVNYISSNLNSNNVGPVLLFAETFGAKDLKRIAMNYILENIEFFSNVEMEVYKLIEGQSPKLFPELLVLASQNFVLQTRKQQ